MRRADFVHQVAMRMIDNQWPGQTPNDKLFAEGLRRLADAVATVEPFDEGPAGPGPLATPFTRAGSPAERGDPEPAATELDPVARVRDLLADVESRWEEFK